ncbi:uncharacterized protein CEXT_387641 [Caerostris extrusa]|uniref:Ig-like domain-containing protein n=1 Tax=Caerostris extrusa TaxID=172846 RepID=A0AAV4UMT2_CAEEX|nr:uncharacterized protein CEXT_387641 [Caerostris extrusa]
MTEHFNHRSISIAVKPTEVLITSLHRPLQEDIPVEVKCLTRGARPSAQVSWWLEEDQLTYPVTEFINKQKQLTISTLTLIPYANYTAKNLTCISENMAIPFSHLADTWLLEIYQLPEDNNSVEFSVLEAAGFHAKSSKTLLKALQCFSADNPEEPENCVAVVTAQCLLVQCKKSEDSGAQNFYHLDVFDTRSDKLLTNLTKLQPDFSVCSLPSTASLLLLLYAINSNGKAASSSSTPTPRTSMGMTMVNRRRQDEAELLTDQEKAYFLDNVEPGILNKNEPVASTSLPAFPTNPISDGGIRSYSNDTNVSMHRSEFPLLSSTSIFKEKLEKKTLYLKTRV